MTTLEAALRDFLRVERSPYTQKQYRLVLTELIHAIGPLRDVERVSAGDLADELARIRASRPLKATTLRNYVGVWTSFFNWCADVDLITRSPARRLHVSGPKQEPVDRAIPTATLNAMVEAVRAHPRNYAILLFLIDTGCRIGGAESLRTSRIDWGEQTALLLEKGSKWHTAFFGDVTAEALRAWLEKRAPAAHDFVFTTLGRKAAPIGRRTISDVVKRAAALAGSEIDWSGHSIRHAVGHAYADADVPIWVTQKKLGHASPEITGHYYPDGRQRLKEASRQLPLAPLGQPPAPAGKVIPFPGRSA